MSSRVYFCVSGSAFDRELRCCRSGDPTLRSSQYIGKRSKVKKRLSTGEMVIVDAKLPYFVPSILFSFLGHLTWTPKALLLKVAFEHKLPYIGSGGLELQSCQLKATGSKFEKCPSTGENVWLPRELSTIDLELHGFVTPLF